MTFRPSKQSRDATKYTPTMLSLLSIHHHNTTTPQLDNNICRVSLLTCNLE
jgi:hypothetical protein